MDEMSAYAAELSLCLQEIKRRMVEEPNKSELESIIKKELSPQTRVYAEV